MDGALRDHRNGCYEAWDAFMRKELSDKIRVTANSDTCKATDNTSCRLCQWYGSCHHQADITPVDW